MAFVEDSLLIKDGGTFHCGQPVSEEKEMTTTLKNFVVLTRLCSIHANRPRLYKQRYSTELQSRTLASIKPEISQALDSLLDELHANEVAKVMNSVITQLHSFSKSSSQVKQQKVY